MDRTTPYGWDWTCEAAGKLNSGVPIPHGRKKGCEARKDAGKSHGGLRVKLIREASPDSKRGIDREREGGGERERNCIVVRCYVYAYEANAACAHLSFWA